MRDSQRQRVYNSEGHCGDVLTGGKLLSFDETKQFVYNMTRHPKFVQRFGAHHNIVVKDGRGRRRGGGYRTWSGGEIRMPRWTRRLYYIIHEVAHTVSTDNHGKQFCGNYLYLVYHFMGETAFHSLRTKFNMNGVKFIETVKLERPTTNDIVANIMKYKQSRKKGNK